MECGHQICDGVISTHAPREGCDVSSRCSALIAGISIPAPREGCHPRKPEHQALVLHFNSRTSQDATSSPTETETVCGFQLTYPVWGATAAPTPVANRGVISTHAPREGCDFL